MNAPPPTPDLLDQSGRGWTRRIPDPHRLALPLTADQIRALADFERHRGNETAARDYATTAATMEDGTLRLPGPCVPVALLQVQQEIIGHDEANRLWMLAQPCATQTGVYLNFRECMHLAQGHSEAARNALETDDLAALRQHCERGGQMIAAAKQIDPAASAFSAVTLHSGRSGHA